MTPRSKEKLNENKNFDINNFVDLKSVSTYGWRVDIERIRSKYFVDMLKDKTEERKGMRGLPSGVSTPPESKGKPEGPPISLSQENFEVRKD